VPVRFTNRHLLLVVALTLCGGIVRFATLDVQSYWLDETVTVEVVRGSLGHVLDRVVDSESSPHLYYILAWAWGHTFGFGEVGLRSLSALIGTATIPVIYVAGARLVDSSSGVVAAAVFAVNPLTIYYSQEARAYGLLILASAVTFVGFAILYTESGPPRRAPLALWAVSCCVALASHYFAIFLIVAEAATLLWLRPRVRRGLILAVVPIGLTGLLLLPLALEQRSHGYADWISEESLPSRCVQVVKQFLVGLDGPAEKATTTLAALLVLIGLWHLFRKGERRRKEGATAALIVGTLAVLSPLLISIVGTDYFNGRNVIAALVPSCVVVGACWASPPRLALLLLAAYAVLSIAIVGVFETDVRYQRDDWRDAARDLGEPGGARAIVVEPDVGRIPLRFYLPSARDLPRGGIRTREVVYVGMGEKPPGKAATAPEPSTLKPPAPGFRLVEQRRAKTYTILRFRSARPLTILPEIAAAKRFSTVSADQAVLVEPAD